LTVRLADPGLYGIRIWGGKIVDMHRTVIFSERGSVQDRVVSPKVISALQLSLCNTAQGNVNIRNLLSSEVSLREASQEALEQGLVMAQESLGHLMMFRKW
jgi:hypothetical protein